MFTPQITEQELAALEVIWARESAIRELVTPELARIEKILSNYRRGLISANDLIIEVLTVTAKIEFHASVTA